MIFLDIQGRQMPALGFGTWQLSGEICTRAVQTALDIGYRHIDTAQIYENEADVGRAIAGSTIPRRELFVTTKIWTTHFEPPHVITSMEESLKKLRMDYVDLLLMHWPNPEVPLEQTLHALQELRRKGKTKAIGISNFPVRLMKEAVEDYLAPVACNQIEYHALLSQRAVLEYAHEHNIIITAYSPLARGRLAKHPLLVSIGEKHDKTASQVALRWLIEQERVAAIPKAASEKNARLNFNIFDFSLSDDDMYAISQLHNNTRVVDPSFAPEWDK